MWNYSGDRAWLILIRTFARKVFLFAVIAMGFIASPLHGQPAKPGVETGPAPAWVEDVAVETTVFDQQAYGQKIILFERQVNRGTHQTFVRVVKEITSETGVQNGANLTFSFDPSFEKLMVHSVLVHREGHGLERLDAGKFKFIQQETDLDRQIYNGQLSAVLFLEDVRVGDRVEYAYTVSGENPVWQGFYADLFLVKWPSPVQHLRQRVLWPADHELHFKSFGTDSEPRMRAVDGLKEYVWDFKNVSAVAMEDQVPSSFPAYPWVQLSSYQDWAEVADWATGLYTNTNLDENLLKARAAELKKDGTGDEQIIQAALDFVQHDIRYLGIEFGPSSYHPADPTTVLQRRFGDCKDKSFLLCTLLRHLGYEATPALVATSFRQALSELLPAANDFNHVIVRVIANGKTFWVDPTAGYQRGPVNERFLPSYGYGLLLQPGETALTPIPTSNAGNPETFTTEVFNVGGQKAATRLKVFSTYRGYDAEWMRAIRSASGQNTFAKSYLNDYAQRYSGIAADGEPDVQDAANRDAVDISHQYIITNFWTLADDKLRYTCQFYPLGIHGWLLKPTTVNRSMPMEISYPRRRVVHTEINLPREFALSNYTNVITGPAAELHIKRTCLRQSVWLDYEYCSLTNFIPVALVSAHLKSLEQMENALGYSLTWQNSDAVVVAKLNWPIFLFAVFYAASCIALLLFICRWQIRLMAQKPAVETQFQDRNLVGLGGWLILVGLNLVIAPVRVVTAIVQCSKAFSPYTWQALTIPGSVSYQPGWAPVLCFELLGQITVLTLAIFGLVLFFKKSRLFPRCFIAMLLANAIFVVVDLILVKSFLKTAGATTGSATQDRALMQVVIGCCIWIPYMLNSRRVKVTFKK